MEYFGAEKNQRWTDEYMDGPFDATDIITEQWTIKDPHINKTVYNRNSFMK